MSFQREKMGVGALLFNFTWPDLAIQTAAVLFNVLLLIFRSVYKIKWFNPARIAFEDYLLALLIGFSVTIFLVIMQFGRYLSLVKGREAQVPNENDVGYIPWHERERSPNPWWPIRLVYNLILLFLFFFMLFRTPFDLGT